MPFGTSLIAIVTPWKAIVELYRMENKINSSESDNKSQIVPSHNEMLQILLMEIHRTLTEISSESFQELVDEIQQADRVFVAGAGRSGLVTRCFAMRLMQLGLCVHVVGEATTPALKSRDLLVIGSGSGRTDRLVRYSQWAEEHGARVAVATADAESPVGQLAHVVLAIPAPTPKTREGARTSKVEMAQPMGSLFEQTLFLAFEACILMLMERLDASESEMMARHANLE